jgi:plastocyanin
MPLDVGFPAALSTSREDRNFVLTTKAGLAWNALMLRKLTLQILIFFSLGLACSRLAATDYFVNVFANAYSPNYLQIAPGDSVYWVNQDDFDHTVTSTANLWTRGYLFGYQDVFGLTFGGTGTYSYYDEFDGFTGTVVVSSAPPPPANDQCSSAIAMTAGTVYSVSTAAATGTGDPAASCATLGKGVWYTYTPTASGLITISTCASDFDTVVSVYTGSCGALTAVSGGCGDDNGPACNTTRASVAFSGTAGTVYRILAGGYSGASGNLKISATNSAPSNPNQEVPVNFDIGPNIARADTNLIHVVDSSNDRLLTLDTGGGAFVSSMRLGGKLASAGLMCFSLDGQYLYVPLYSSNKLQVISLATLTTEDLVPLSVSPNSIASGFDGAMYTMANSQITKINPVTGQTLAAGRSFYEPIIKANASGTKLFVMELGLSGGGSMIDEYAVVPSGSPTFVTSHFNSKANDKDFVIAEDIGWLYSTSGGVYGVGAWNMNSRAYYYWPYDSPYGDAVAMIPNDGFVYGASGASTPRIRRFDRLTGAVSATYDLAAGSGLSWITDRSLKVTPNGRIFYARDTRKIGLIGSSTLTTNLPATAELVDAGTNRTVFAGQPFTVNALATGVTNSDVFRWTKIAGPGQVSFSLSNSLTTGIQIGAPGSYTLQITRSNAAWQSRDLLYVTAVAQPLSLSQPGLNAAGRFEMRLLGGPGTIELQASSNLVNWDVISNVVSPDGDIRIADPITNRARRFYRARLTQ